MDVKFGTSGLRGLSRDLLDGAAAAHVVAFCRHLGLGGALASGGEILVARDRRESSPALAAQAVSAIEAEGFAAIDCGEVPTPALAHAAFARDAAAIMITGSHIPANRNGLKFYLPGAEISKADEAGIAASLPADWAAPVAQEPRAVLEREVAQAFRARYRGLLKPDALAGLDIGVHDHSSVATDIIAGLLGEFGARVTRFGASGHFVPVDTEAVGPDLLELYRANAAASGLDAIVSTDADGDRPLVVDETGRPLPGDLLGWLAAMFVGATSIATPVTSNSAIVARPGLEVRRTRVGSPFVIAAMDEAAAAGAACVAGFEANGGFLLGSAATAGGARLAALPTRDSVLPILATLAKIASSGTPASGLRALEGFRFTAADRLQDYETARSAALMQALGDGAFRSRFLDGLAEVTGSDATDGLRLFLKDGSVIHFRPSGNAPEMRCYCEATTGEQAAGLLGEGLRRLAAWRP